MLRFLFLLLLVALAALPTQAQETIVDQPPALIGGLSALADEIRYSEAAKDAGEQGTVVVQLVVDEDGRGTDPEVLRGVTPALDAEALRVAQQARFTPGRNDGELVKVKFAVPIKFVLPAPKVEDR